MGTQNQDNKEIWRKRKQEHALTLTSSEEDE